MMITHEVCGNIDLVTDKHGGHHIQIDVFSAHAGFVLGDLRNQLEVADVSHGYNCPSSGGQRLTIPLGVADEPADADAIEGDATATE